MNPRPTHVVDPLLRGLRRSAGVLALAAILVACGGGGDADGESGAGGDGSVDGTAAVTVTDDTGTEVALPEPAESIVCLDVVCLDALRELDLTPVASAQGDVVAHPAFYGTESGIDIVGGTFFEPDLEGILAAQPDLVLGAATVHGELRAALGSLPLYLADLDATDAQENLRAVGELTGRQQEAEAAVERYEETTAAYAGEREVSLLSMYGGATADIGIDAADSAIGESIGSATAYPWPTAGEGDGGFLEINLEQILDVDPEWIWVLDFGFDPQAPPLVDQLAEEAVWGPLQAVRSGQVEAAPAWWGGTNGTFTQQLVLDTVMPVVYPEEFPEPLGPLAGS